MTTANLTPTNGVPSHAPPPQPQLLPPPRGANATSPRWHYRARPGAQDESLATACGISPVTAAILRARGCATPGAVQAFLHPPLTALRDPRGLPDIEPAIARLHRAITTGEPMLVFGDYDVDGVTSTALLMRTLRVLKANARHRIPERTEGYGLKMESIEEAHRLGVTLILTADCGITAIAPVQRARELGIDVIITDHHEPGAELPPALAVINPKRADSAYGFRELCGCGVAFKVTQALLETHWPRHAEAFFEKFVELAGLATIADCVPLEDENRVLAREGLRRLAGTNKLGLQALIKSARLKITGDTLHGRHVGFGLGPRLNAAGRLDTAETSLRLLMSTDPAECERLAAELEEHNKLRQDTTHRVFREAAQLVQEKVDLSRDCLVVVDGADWHQGIVGLVASRLVERYSRPAIVLHTCDGVAHGSGRSIPNFDLHALIVATQDLLLSGGGHAAACGLSLEVGHLEEFRARALACAAQHIKIDDLVPLVEADCLVRGTDVTAQLIADLACLEPCGQANPEPMFMAQGARLLDGRAIGANNEHLKWRVQLDGHYFEAVWWRPGDKANGFRVGQTVDLCFVPELNTWNGVTKVQLNLKDARTR